MLLCCSMAWTAENTESGAVHRLSWAVGYDEGLAGKLFVTEKISVNAALGYMVTGARSPIEQPTNTLSLKIGGDYLLKEFDKLRMNAFFEFAEQMKQGQVQYATRVGGNKRYNQWNEHFRLGLSPELFITDHFSLTYKFGLQMAIIGNTYKLNDDESGTESNDDSHIKFGVYGFESNEPFMLLHNFCLMFYF